MATAIFSRTRSAHLEHEQAKADLKKLVPQGRPRLATASGPSAQTQASLASGRARMQRSSNSVGGLWPLAKAQAELVNPEKSLVGSIYLDSPGGAERIFRYTPCRLDSTSFARRLGNMRLLWCRRPRSTRPQASLISPLC